MQPLGPWAAFAAQLLWQWAHRGLGRCTPGCPEDLHTNLQHGLMQPMLLHHGLAPLHHVLLVPAAMMQPMLLQQGRLMHQGLMQPVTRSYSLIRGLWQSLAGSLVVL